MKMKLLTGPVEWGVRLTREEGDGLAWDVMVASLARWQEKRTAEAEWAAELEKILTVLGGWGGRWYCGGCDSAQTGAPPFPDRPGRCAACGPGGGFVPCPATHGQRACPLCRGIGYVEELAL